MADEADAASEKDEITLAAYIRQIRERAASQPLALTGYCWNCNEQSGNRLFCSPECRSDYDERQRLAKLNGRKF